MLPLLYLALFWLLCSGVGYGPCLLLPGRWRRDRLLMMPVAGAGLLILATSVASYAGLPMRSSAPLIAGGGLLVSAGSVWLAWRWPAPAVAWRSDAFVHAIGFTAACSLLVSLFLYRAWDPYSDAFTYMTIADYLQDHGAFAIADPGAHHPALTQVATYQHHGYRMGANFLLALFTALVRAPYAFDVYLPAVALAVWLGVPGFWLLCRRALAFRPTEARFATVLFGLHLGVPIPNALLGFMPQTFGLALVFPLMVWQVRATSRRHRVGLILAAGLMYAIALITYPEILPFVVAAIACCYAWRVAVGRLGVRDALTGMVAPGLIGLLLAPVAAANFVSALRMQAGALVGWDVRLSLFDYLSILSGFRSMLIPTTQPPGLKHALLRVAVLGAVAVVGYGMFTMRPTTRQRFACLSLPFTVGLVLFGLFGANPWNPAEYGHPWHAYKLMTYGFFLFAALWGLGLASLWRGGGLFRLAALVELGVFVAFFPVATTILATRNATAMRQFTGMAADPVAEYRRLPELLAHLPSDMPINLVMPPETLKHRQIVAYFLARRPVIADWSNDGYIWPNLAPANRALPIDPGYPSLVYTPAPGQPKAANLVYQRGGTTLTASFGNDWYGVEVDGPDSWRWLEREGRIDLDLPTAGWLTFKADVSVIGGPRTITVAVAGRPDLEEKYALPQQWFAPFTSRRIHLAAGHYTVTVAADGPATVMAPTDPRVVRIGLRNVTWALVP
jgi:hypothetical protein